jgi:hypothetical protein
MVSEELKKEIGNAFAAYRWILNAAVLQCQIPSEFEKFKDLEWEDVHHRLQLLQDFYNQL